MIRSARASGLPRKNQCHYAVAKVASHPQHLAAGVDPVKREARERIFRYHLRGRGVAYQPWQAM